MATKLQTAKKKVTDLKKELKTAEELFIGASTEGDKKTANQDLEEAKTNLVEAEKTLQNLQDENANDSNQKTTKPAKSDDETITVIASEDRRRAGVKFPKGQPITIILDDFDDTQIWAIRNDPILSIQK